MVEHVAVARELGFTDDEIHAAALVSVHCETWEGFIFVNFAVEPAETLLEFLGEVATGLTGYPCEPTKLRAKQPSRSPSRSNDG